MDRQLGSLHFLTIGNTMAVNKDVKISPPVLCRVLDYMPRKTISVSHRSSIFSFLSNSTLISIEAIPVALPEAVLNGFSSPHL